MGYPQGLEHLVVVTLENRSFDHVLGALGNDPEWVRRHPGARVASLDVPYTNADLTGHLHRTGAFPDAHARRHVWHPDAPHGSEPVRLQMSRSRPDTPASEMGGFVEAFQRAHPGVADPGDIMMHFTRSQVPISYHFADHFAVCDHWFSPVAGDTFPNRMYALAGDSGGIETTGFNWKFLTGAALTTVFEEMQRFGDSWAMYSGVLPMGLALPGVRRLCGYTHGSPTGGSRWMSQFAIDAANDQLPKLSWLEPTYYWHANGAARKLPSDPTFPDPCCDHPPADIASGQRFLRWVYNVLCRNPHIWEKTALVITYDEHGGFFDHVPPPEIHQVERNVRIDGRFSDSFVRRGPRVPAFIIAPWVRSGVISDRLDHCSILKFICEWCGIPPWTDRISSPRISSLAVAFEGKILVQVPPPPPAAPDIAMPSPQGPVPVEPDLGPWLEQIHGQLKRSGSIAVESPVGLVASTIGDHEDVLSRVALENEIHTIHVVVPDIDVRVAELVLAGGSVVGDYQVDGQRVVVVGREDQTRSVLWSAQPHLQSVEDVGART